MKFPLSSLWFGLSFLVFGLSACAQSASLPQMANPTQTASPTQMVSPPQMANPPLSRADWGAELATVSHENGQWIIKGQKQTVTLDEKNLALDIQAGPAKWDMVPSTANDMLVQWHGKLYTLRLADARTISIVPYDTGYQTGLLLTLSDWKNPDSDSGQGFDLTLYLTMGLEGDAEDLVFSIAAQESDAAVYQLDWPTALDPNEADFTVLTNRKGDLLPRNWPKAYLPITNGKASDHSLLQSHVIEDWAMSWWGFEQGPSAMMIIVETPDDAAYQFSHPAGGPTVIGPRWRESLGRLGYPRSMRMCFFPRGNYVDLAEAYRRYVLNTGLFVSLKEKISRAPEVAKIIGVPQTRIRILVNQSTQSDRYNPATHYHLTTFDEWSQQLRALKAAGVNDVLVFIAGWADLGYDRQHPDPLPPPAAAGGWAGLKRLTDTCQELGYPFIFHDQYRDFYLDAPSWDPQFAIHEQDANPPATEFPGSRFGDWKQGQIPFMRHWDGGVQSYLDARFMPGNLVKNYDLFFKNGIHPDGIYLDVFGYVPPDEDFNPEHPTTRSEAMASIASMFNWSRNNLGVVLTEAGSDWVIPYVDSVNQSGGVGQAIPVPLYQLVYHDAVLVSFGGGNGDGRENLLRGILYGGVPEMSVDMTTQAGNSLALIREMAALNKRVGLLAMTNHEFLNPDRSQERTTFADGTTVTADWKAGTVKIEPALTQVELNASGIK
jgi:Family of unknown function (DUF5696)